MEYSAKQIRDILMEKGLKVTPQRISILEAIYALGNHPTADRILEHITKVHPGIASGTVYKVLDVLVEKELIKRVNTERDVMRYDGILETHHHLYCAESEQIEDYKDEELDRMLADYFVKHGIKDFEIQEIKLHIKGKFLNPDDHERKKH
jgi:Fur family peroxide stress response transcriptional regulator